MRERNLEKYLDDIVANNNGLRVKLKSTNLAGIPDDMVLFKNGKIAFIELKQDGKKPTNLQLYYIDVLRLLGFQAEWLDSKQKINQYIYNVLQKEN